ncbi:metal ABC transporter ATP-binding protein [Pokkaliibacter sp. CJK22405]|uniref:metal ABC transporter ATP-binding protein n=1 Tax=Pokkaliibacter sp. CJK22405 TaxID=3384615 RepID=UPI0039848211
MTAITLSEVSAGYQRHIAIEQVEGVFATGSMTAIVGPNGAGKSTLLKTLMGELKPLAGKVQFTHHSPAGFGYLPQLSGIDRSFPLSVMDTVLMGAWQHTGIFRGVSRQVRKLADAALAKVGLEGFGQRSISMLSAGQFQRVLFARLLVQDAPVILLDEPFNAIDARTSSMLLGLLREWHHEGRTLIAVLHDYQQVQDHFPETLLLARRVIGWGATADVLTQANVESSREQAERWEEEALAPAQVAFA